MGTLASKSSDVLSNLISTGADAAPNLFEVIFNSKDEDVGKQLSMRITNFVAPERAVTTVTLPYQGTIIVKPSPGTTINNLQKFNFRVDKDYQIYKYLKSKLLNSSQGYNDFSVDKKIDNITVNLLSPEDDENLIIRYSWEFLNCYLIDIAPLSLDYSNTGGLTSVLSFVYQECIEK